MEPIFDYPLQANNRCFMCKKTVFNIETLRTSKKTYVLCDNCFEFKSNDEDIKKMKLFDFFTKGSRNVFNNRGQS